MESSASLLKRKKEAASSDVNVTYRLMTTSVCVHSVAVNFLQRELFHLATLLVFACLRSPLVSYYHISIAIIAFFIHCTQNHGRCTFGVCSAPRSVQDASSRGIGAATVSNVSAVGGEFTILPSNFRLRKMIQCYPLYCISAATTISIKTRVHPE